jgi:hypothetical protein
MRAILVLTLLARASGKLADGCARVYVDFGSNAGIQIRKMYEPWLFEQYYEGNPSEHIFSQVFGRERHDVCTFGFEASPRHTARLTALQQAYIRTGRRVVFYTDTAVSTSNTNVSFYIQYGDGLIDGSAGMHPETGRQLVEARAVDLAEWMLEHVVGRSLPAGGAVEPRVLMKSDIEGHDMAVLDRLFRHGGLCHVHTLYYEGAHMSGDWAASMRAKLAHRGCATTLIDVDDETGQGGEAFLKPDSPYFLQLPDSPALARP